MPRLNSPIMTHPYAANTLVLQAPVKLNLFLHINGQITTGRFQGYHQLQTYFQRVGYGDELHITPTDAPVIEVHWQAGDEPLTHRPQRPEDDLIWRAAHALQRYAINQGHSVGGAHISVIKNAPVGGGLGGGSSAAASALRALNQLWSLHCPATVLLEIGRSLGADVPVFVAGHNAWAEGIGDQLTPRPSPLAEHWFVIVSPKVHRPTAASFADPALKKNTPREPQSWLPQWQTKGVNAFEPLCLTDPIIASCYAALQETTGFARITGSGACIFSPLPNEDAARQAADKISRKIKTTGRLIVAPALADAPLFNHENALNPTKIR